MKNIILTILLFLACNVFSQNIPKNATYNQFTVQGWSCNSGYKKNGDVCNKVKVPKNARINDLSVDGWSCNSGYIKYFNQCNKVKVPKNARINDLSVDGWSCNSGYIKYDNQCNKVKVPKNARINDFSVDGWSCNSGYIKYDNQCNKVKVPKNARINDYAVQGWSCNNGYHAVDNTCVLMTADELAKEAELKRKITAYEKRQKALGHCETEYKTGAEVCVSNLNVDLDCTESYSGNYYNNCMVELSYKVETDYSGSSYIDATIKCEVEIEYSGRNTYSTNHESDSQRHSHTLWAHDILRKTSDFDFDFWYYDEINKVEISDAKCKVADVYMY